MLKYLPLGLLMLLASMSAAFAAPVTFAVGDWVTSVLPVFSPVLALVLAGVVAFALRALPPSIAAALKTLLTEQLLQRAVDYALNTVEGAAKGKVVTANIANSVVATAAQYVSDHAPAWLAEFEKSSFVGELEQKIIARLNLAPDAKVVDTGAGPAVVQVPAADPPVTPAA